MAILQNSRRISGERLMSEQDPNERPIPDESASEPAPVSPGIQLRAQREAYGWTVEQVAAELNMAPRQIAAIEADNYAALPGMPITRGFIRAYAKLLRIDAAPLLVTLGGNTVSVPDTVGTRKAIPAPFSEARLPSMMERKSGFSAVFVGAILVSLAAGAGWVVLNGAGLPALTEVKSSLPTLGATTAPAPGQVESPLTSPAVEAKPPVALKSTETLQLPAAVTPSAPQPAPVEQASAESAVPAAPAPAKDELLLQVREETWVEAKHATDNKVVLSRLMKPGESQSLDVTEPISLVVGNASGVALTLRGVPVELKGGNGNVARLTLK
jgi:cytoskeleton protein RodZ